MKKYISYIIAVPALSLALFSCGKWLDVMQDDNISEKDLFSNFDGYHSAVNGIYQSLSQNDLFGKELSYGFVSALSQYLTNNTPDDDLAYSYTEKYQFATTEVRDYASGIWEAGYKVIADCNNLIAHVEAADRSIFPNADRYFEPELIRGEAYAVRAFMHFELLRLFAPAPIVDMDAQAIPYRDTYQEQFKEFSTNREVLRRIIADLELAYGLVELFDRPDDFEDGTSSAASSYLQANMRFTPSNSAPGLFFNVRGCRFNSIAIKSLMARVYAYMNDLENAYKHASEVYKRVVEDRQLYTYTVFPTGSNVLIGDQPHKMMNEIVIAFYSMNLAIRYDQRITGTTLQTPTYFIKNVDYMYRTFRNDADDVRLSPLLVNKVETSVEPQYYSLRYAQMTNATSIENYVIPVMRMSELRYIMAEYLAKKTPSDVPAAVEILNDHRSKRRCARVLDTTMSQAEFLEELEYDMWKEFTAEGQLFFYYKRTNAERIRNGAVFIPMSREKYTVPIPDSELNFENNI